MLNFAKRLMARVFRPAVRVVTRTIRGRYDAAQTGKENENHWASADDLSPASANTPEIRRVLRKRARYERDNDPHLNGLVKTLSSDLIGSGPRLQLQLPQGLYESGRLVEQSFAAWCRSVDYAEKLRLMHEARPIDGESFGITITNPMVSHPVKLDVVVIESEQVATPGLGIANNYGYADGIEFDAYGNPTYYHVLKEHPGDSWAFGIEYSRVPARNVVHWFRPSRPGQTRGVSEFASSLPIGAQTRRYASAVLSAAEFAASIAGVMEVPAPLDGAESAPEIAVMDEVPIARGALLTVPSGSNPQPFKSEQPTSTYREFSKDKRAEMGRPVLAPRNQVTGDSSDFNFASGRLDHLPYQRIIWIERERMRNRVLDKLFLAWVKEAAPLGLIPADLPAINEWAWDWHWDGFASLDPTKDTAATKERLAMCLTTLAEECAGEGKNWREVIDQRALEREYMISKGIDPDAGLGIVKPAAQQPQDQQQDQGAANAP